MFKLVFEHSWEESYKPKKLNHEKNNLFSTWMIFIVHSNTSGIGWLEREEKFQKKRKRWKKQLFFGKDVDVAEFLN